MKDSDESRDDMSRGFGSPFSGNFFRIGVIFIGFYLYACVLGGLPQPLAGFLLVLSLFAWLIYSYHDTGALNEERNQALQEDTCEESDQPTIFFSVPSTGMHDHLPQHGYEDDVLFRSLMIRNQMNPRDFR